jgi:hypothetical protein
MKQTWDIINKLTRSEMELKNLTEFGSKVFGSLALVLGMTHLNIEILDLWMGS